MTAAKWGWHILGVMERRAPWFPLVAVVLVAVGLVSLAAPAPAHAMDPQLILALASAAGAVALIAGYLIVANGREKQRAASLEGVYACGERESAGPMGCGGPVDLAATTPVAPSDSPMVAGRGTAAVAAAAGATPACAGAQAAGPMGCSGGPVGSGHAPSAPAPSQPTVAAIQGQ
jgi:hypothetical protein